MRTKLQQDVGDRPRVLTRFERQALAVEALGMDERTVQCAYENPLRVRESTLRRLDRAAKRLGLPSPWNFDAKPEGDE
jgi:hypothetical protein